MSMVRTSWPMHNSRRVQMLTMKQLFWRYLKIAVMSFWTSTPSSLTKTKKLPTVEKWIRQQRILKSTIKLKRLNWAQLYVTHGLRHFSMELATSKCDSCELKDYLCSYYLKYCLLRLCYYYKLRSSMSQYVYRLRAPKGLDNTLIKDLKW